MGDILYSQVDDCIAKFEWMKQMTTQMAALKRQGKPIPKSVEDLEQSVGNWRGYREQQPQSSAAGNDAEIKVRSWDFLNLVLFSLRGTITHQMRYD
jgi:hypothetical protein